MGSVHQFPAKRNQGAAGPATEVTRALRRAVDAHVGVDATFEQREQLALALANDATRQFLQDDLEAIAERHGAVAPPRRPVSRSSSSARTGAASDGVPMVSMPC